MMISTPTTYPVVFLSVLNVKLVTREDKKSQCGIKELGRDHGGSRERSWWMKKHFAYVAL